MLLVGGGVAINFDFPAGGSCLNCSNKIIKKNPRSLRLLVFYYFISYIWFVRPINFSAFIFASAKVILFCCFYCHNHADFYKKID